MGATETVTVLFTDLVGSTELLSRLGPEAAEDLRREHFALLRAAVDASGGREVKNVGDGLMIVFPSAVSAVGCAIGMQQRVHGHNAGGGEPLGLRVGIAGGDAEVDEHDYFGPPVVEAARLCARADGGQILASDLVRLTARARGDYEFDALGPLDLKGLDEPVVAHTVAWAPAAAEPSAVPLPARLTMLDSGFCGRVEERARLEAMLKDASSGDRRAVLLSGEPGIGKTSLAAWMAAEAHRGGATVLYGRSDEDLGIPYQPWVEALGHLIDHAADDVVDAAAARPGLGDLARLVPALGHRVGQPAPGGDGDLERHVLYAAVTGLLADASSSQPLVVILDDLHWADTPTLTLLRHVVSSPEVHRVMLVGTFRDSVVDAGHALADALAALHREPGVERIALRGLDDDALLELMEDAAGHQLDDDGIALRDALREETDGNPFFVSEILRHLAETGAISQEADGRWVAMVDLQSTGLPVSVREVIGRRVARLGEDVGTVLTTAAVIGRDFDLDVLAAALGTDPEPVLDAIDAAVDAGLVKSIDSGRCAFEHALVAHTVADALTPARRANVHQRIAEALEARCGDDPGERVGELAHHWSEATTPQPAAKALEYARLAADRALAQLAPDEALRWYTRALELLEREPAPDERVRGEILVGLGDAQRQLGEPAYRETLLEAARIARGSGDVAMLVRAAIANSRGLLGARGGEVDAERIGVLEDALAAVGDADSIDRARLLAVLAIELWFWPDGERRRRVIDEAVEVARRVGDPVTLCDVLSAFGFTFADSSTIGHEQRSRLAGEVTQLAGGLDDPVRRFWASHAAFTFATLNGDRAEPERFSAVMTAVADELGQPTLRWLARTTAGVQALRGGDPERAEQLAEEALALGVEGGEPDALTWYGGQLLFVRNDQGRLGELEDLLAEAVAESPGLLAFRFVLAGCRAARGERGEGQALLDDLATGRLVIPDDPLWWTSIAVAAELAGDLEHAGAAGVLLGLLTPTPDVVVYPGVAVLGCAAMYAARVAIVLGRLDDAEQLLHQARTVHERMESPYYLARVDLHRAELDLSRGAEPAAARDRLVEVVDIAATRGYGGLERRARELLGEPASD